MKAEIEHEAPSRMQYDLGNKFNDDLLNLIKRSIQIMDASKLGEGEVMIDEGMTAAEAELTLRALDDAYAGEINLIFKNYASSVNSMPLKNAIKGMALARQCRKTLRDAILNPGEDKS